MEADSVPLIIYISHPVEFKTVATSWVIGKEKQGFDTSRMKLRLSRSEGHLSSELVACSLISL